MNDTFNLNGNNYFNDTDDSDDPICAGQGLYCPFLYTVNNLILCITTIGELVFIPFILYLIFAKVKDSFFKYFTLNVIFTCIVSATVGSISNIIYFFILFRGLKGRIYLRDIGNWTARFTYLAYMWFLALLLYAAIVPYLLYVKPMFFAKKFTKNHIPYYAVLHISILLWGSFTILFSYRTGNFLLYDLTHIALFIALFIVAVMGTIKISKYKSLRENFIQASKLQQKRLYSFIVYTYSVEVITLPMFVYECLQIACMFTDCKTNLVMNKFKYMVIKADYFSRRMRLISISLITILACEPFRRATISLFIRKKWTTEVKSIRTLKTKQNS